MSDISLQLRFGGGDDIQGSGYEESQSESSCGEFVYMLDKKMNCKVSNSIMIDIEVITLDFIFAIIKLDNYKGYCMKLLHDINIKS